jgi:hypothetical protein
MVARMRLSVMLHVTLPVLFSIKRVATMASTSLLLSVSNFIEWKFVDFSTVISEKESVVHY